MQVKPRAAFAANARSRQSAAGPFHEIRTPGHVPTTGGNRSPQVLDQRPCHQISPHLRWLLRLHQFAVAVVDETDAIRLTGMDPLAQPTDLSHRQGWPPAVTTAALDQNQTTGDRQRCIERGLIHATPRHQGQFVVEDAELRQRSLPIATQTDHLLQRVVRTARDRKHAITRTKHAEQGRCNRMGSAHELKAHRSRFSTQNAREHPVQHLTALVAVAVTGQRCEVLGADPLVSKGLQHLLKPIPHGGGSGSRLGLQAISGCSHKGFGPLMSLQRIALL